MAQTVQPGACPLCCCITLSHLPLLHLRITASMFPSNCNPLLRRALFHCNYCNKDISNTIRVKCAVCPDFDLCLECFSVGVEIHPHKRSHAYRVVDNLSFPLFAPDWGVRTIWACNTRPLENRTS